jgi:hypothetical protein
MRRAADHSTVGQRSIMRDKWRDGESTAERAPSAGIAGLTHMHLDATLMMGATNGVKLRFNLVTAA